MRRKNIAIIVLSIVLIGVVITSIILMNNYSTESNDLSVKNKDLQRQLTETITNLEEINEELNIVKNELASNDTTKEKLSDDNEKLINDNEKLNKDIIDLTEQISALESDLEKLTLNYNTLQIDYVNRNASYQEVSQELSKIQEVYPLKYFTSLGLLEDWVDENIDPYQSTLDPEVDFKEACKIVEKGIQDGYWIGISFRYQNNLLIIECSAIAGGQAYTFYPFGGNIAPWPLYK